MINGLKRVLLFVRKIVRYCKYRMVSWISYLILVFCAALFCAAVFTNIAHRVPIISKLGERIHLPQKFELTCVVKINDLEGPVIIPIEMNIGGFSKRTSSGDEFNLEFVSNSSENIPVIIIYKYNGTEYNKIEYVSFESDYSIKCVFNYDIGE